MKVLVKYTVFIPDNYQGCSGDVRDFELLLDFNEKVIAVHIKESIRSRIELEVKKITHGWDGYRYQIVSSLILNET